MVTTVGAGCIGQSTRVHQRIALAFLIVAALALAALADSAHRLRRESGRITLFMIWRYRWRGLFVCLLLSVRSPAHRATRRPGIRHAAHVHHAHQSHGDMAIPVSQIERTRFSVTASTSRAPSTRAGISPLVWPLGSWTL